MILNKNSEGVQQVREIQPAPHELEHSFDKLKEAEQLKETKYRYRHTEGEELPQDEQIVRYH
jgi:hypothetical protein